MSYTTNDEGFLDIEFTHSTEDRVSSFIDGIWHNANDNSLSVDVDNEIWYYYNISKDAYRAFASADSLGGHYNTVIKPVYGPGENLGDWSKVDHILVAENKPETSTPATPKGLRTVTIEHSLAPVASPVFDHSVSGSPISTDTVEHSLSVVALPEPVTEPFEGETVTSTVYFTLEGGSDRQFEFEGNARSLEDAIKGVDEHVRRIGTTGNVKRVVFDFA